MNQLTMHILFDSLMGENLVIVTPQGQVVEGLKHLLRYMDASH